MSFCRLRRGFGAGGRAAALLALAQCGVVGTPSWTEGDGLGSAESESSDPDDSDDSNDSNSEEGTASSDGESESSNTTLTSTTSSTVTSTTSTSTTSTSTTSTTFGTTSSGTSSGPTSGWMTNGVTSAPDSADDTADAGGMSTTTTGPGGEEESGGGEPVVLDCDAPMPTSGATMRSGNGTGGSGNLAWEIWSNTTRGELVTYDVPAFSAIWNEAGGYLGRLGYEWGGFQSNPVPHEQVGTITAQFVSRKSGSAGIYSYVGMYGWTTDPCVEWYVVEDSFNNMPINPGSLDMSFGDSGVEEINVDGGTYLVYKRPTDGTGGTRCSGETMWQQYYSVRTTARDCGQISLTEHFEAWESLGLPMGNLLEAKILVEVGGGQGRVDLPIANVMVTP